MPTAIAKHTFTMTRKPIHLQSQTRQGMVGSLKKKPRFTSKKKKKNLQKNTPAKTSKGVWRSVPFTHPLTFEATSFKFLQKEASSQITLKLALHPQRRRALSHANPRCRRPLIFSLSLSLDLPTPPISLLHLHSTGHH